MTVEKIILSLPEDATSFPYRASEKGPVKGDNVTKSHDLSRQPSDVPTQQPSPNGAVLHAPKQQPSPNGAVLQGQVKENDGFWPRGNSNTSTRQPSHEGAVRVSHEEVTIRPWPTKAKLSATPFSYDEGAMMPDSIGRQSRNTKRAG